MQRSSDQIDLLQHHRSLKACIEHIIDRKHVEESQADGESHKTVRVITSLSSCSMYRFDYTIDNVQGMRRRSIARVINQLNHILPKGACSVQSSDFQCRVLHMERHTVAWISSRG